MIRSLKGTYNRYFFHPSTFRRNSDHTGVEKLPVVFHNFICMSYDIEDYRIMTAYFCSRLGQKKKRKKCRICQGIVSASQNMQLANPVSQNDYVEEYGENPGLRRKLTTNYYHTKSRIGENTRYYCKNWNCKTEKS